MKMPHPTPVYRIMHVDNLATCLHRRALYSPNHAPSDGLPCRTIHNQDIQEVRRARALRRGPGGVVHDYVAFYFGPRSPMLYQLHTGWVAGYKEGQAPIIYVVTTAQAVADSGAGYVFSDGHGIAAYTSWFDDLDALDQVDWDTVYCEWWRDTVEDMDRQRRKQAEFLIHRKCDWDLIQEIGVLDKRMAAKVEGILSQFDNELTRPVVVRRNWYYREVTQ